MNFADYLKAYMAQQGFNSIDIAFFLQATPKSVDLWLKGTGPTRAKAVLYRQILSAHGDYFHATKEEVKERTGL